MTWLRGLGFLLIALGAVGVDKARQTDDGWALATAIAGIGVYLVCLG